MRLKAKPKKPTNPIVRHEKEVNDWPLDAIIAELPEGIKPEDAFIEARLEYYAYDGDRAESILVYQAPRHTEEEFNKLLDNYKKKLKLYNEWYEGNKEEIEAAIAERENKKLLQKKNKIKKLQKERERLEKEIAALQIDNL